MAEKNLLKKQRENWKTGKKSPKKGGPVQKPFSEDVQTPIHDLRTHRVELEMQIEDRYRQMFDNMTSCVAVYEPIADGTDFIIRDFNRSAERIEKVKKEDIIGKSVLEVFPGVVKFGLFEVFKRVWKTGLAEHMPVSEYHDNRITGWKDNYIYKLP